MMLMLLKKGEHYYRQAFNFQICWTVVQYADYYQTMVEVAQNLYLIHEKRLIIYRGADINTRLIHI